MNLKINKPATVFCNLCEPRQLLQSTVTAFVMVTTEPTRGVGLGIAKTLPNVSLCLLTDRCECEPYLLLNGQSVEGN